METCVREKRPTPCLHRCNTRQSRGEEMRIWRRAVALGLLRIRTMVERR